MSVTEDDVILSITEDDVINYIHILYLYAHFHTIVSEPPIIILYPYIGSATSLDFFNFFVEVLIITVNGT